MAYISSYEVPINGTNQKFNFKDSALREDVADLQTFIGYPDPRAIGLQADFENRTYARLGAAAGKNAGADFDVFSMYGGRKKCNLADDGTVNAWYGDNNYVEDGSNGQVMVYQPKFYYKITPTKKTPREDGKGYIVHKANYFISEVPLTGFKVHPAFFNDAGQEVDGIFLSAYEGSIYDNSELKYLIYDDLSDDGELTPSTYIVDTEYDKFCSVAGVKPASGAHQTLTRANIELLCKNRGPGWHSENIQTVSMEQLLFAIEYGFNSQTAVGRGVSEILDGPSGENCAAQTGATAAIGNGTGVATSTDSWYNGEKHTFTNKILSVCYRGRENVWGNIYTVIDGINVYGDGTLLAGEVYYCTNHNYEESKRIEQYVSTGTIIPNLSTGSPILVSAFTWSDDCDWIFLPAEGKGRGSNDMIADIIYVTNNLNRYNIGTLGGCWPNGAAAGLFLTGLSLKVNYSERYVGGRIVYFG